MSEIAKYYNESIPWDHVYKIERTTPLEVQVQYTDRVVSIFDFSTEEECLENFLLIRKLSKEAHRYGK